MADGYGLVTADVLLVDWADKKRFGTLSFVFRDGNIVLIREEQTLVPPIVPKESDREAAGVTSGAHNRFRTADR